MIYNIHLHQFAQLQQTIKDGHCSGVSWSNRELLLENKLSFRTVFNLKLLLDEASALLLLGKLNHVSHRYYPDLPQYSYCHWSWSFSAEHKAFLEVFEAMGEISHKLGYILHVRIPMVHEYNLYQRVGRLST